MNGGLCSPPGKDCAGAGFENRERLLPPLPLPLFLRDSVFLRTAQEKKSFPPLLLRKGTWVKTPFQPLYIRYYRLEVGILQWIAGPEEDRLAFARFLREELRALKIPFSPAPPQPRFPFLPSFLRPLFLRLFPVPEKVLHPLETQEQWEELQRSLAGEYQLFLLDGTLFLDPSFPRREELLALLEREVLQRGRTFLLFAPYLPERQCPWDERYLIELAVLHPAQEELRRLEL